MRLIKTLLFAASALFTLTRADEDAGGGVDEEIKRLVVRFIDNIPLPDSLETLLALLDINVEQLVGEVLFALPDLSMLVALLPMGTAKLLENLPIVKYIEEDSLVSLILPILTGTPVTSLQAQGNSDVPGGEFRDDGDFVPFGIEAVQALGISNSNVANRKVCIIDSGFDASHNDLPGTDVVTGAEDIGAGPWFQDGLGHGTHVAGTIAAVGGNGGGVMGVTHNAQMNLFIVRVLDAAGDFTFGSNLVAAAQECVDTGANVISMSIGGPKFTQYTSDAFEQFYNNGVLLVASAGNDGNTAFNYPASYSSVISVAAIDENKRVASFSQQNSQVELAAPGVGVWSTLPNDEYAAWDGTSMACPHVSAVAALIWSFYPNESPQRIRQVMAATAQDLGPSGWDQAYGYGLVQAASALQCLEDGLCTAGDTMPTSPPPSTGDGDCVDAPAGWVDSDGDGCDYYNSQTRCSLFGSSFENDGNTANDVCCQCGGGEGGGGDACEDDPPGWVDSLGDGCDWYSVDDRCETFALEIGTNGKTPIEACCVCQGSLISGTALFKADDTGDGTSSAAGLVSTNNKIASLLSLTMAVVAVLKQCV